MSFVTRWRMTANGPQSISPFSGEARGQRGSFYRLKANTAEERRWSHSPTQSSLQNPPLAHKFSQVCVTNHLYSVNFLEPVGVENRRGYLIHRIVERWCHLNKQRQGSLACSPGIPRLYHFCFLILNWGWGGTFFFFSLFLRAELSELTSGISNRRKWRPLSDREAGLEISIIATYMSVVRASPNFRSCRVENRALWLLRFLRYFCGSLWELDSSAAG